MSKPAIITVAITGALPRKKGFGGRARDAEQRADRIDACGLRGGRDHRPYPRPQRRMRARGSDPELYAKVQEGVRKHCPGMIVQHSTGGRGRSQEERGRCVLLEPDMASLATGSVNFPNQIYENPPSLVEGLARSMRDHRVKPEIEVFDTAMLYNAKALLERGLVAAPAHVQFVMGIVNALPARRQAARIPLVSELEELMPGATWTAAGIGRHQLEVNHWLPRARRATHALRARRIICGSDKDAPREEQCRARRAGRRVFAPLWPRRHACRSETNFSLPHDLTSHDLSSARAP